MYFYIVELRQPIHMSVIQTKAILQSLPLLFVVKHDLLEKITILVVFIKLFIIMIKS